MAEQTGDEPAGGAAPPPPVDPLTAGRPAGRLTSGQLALLRRYGEVRPTVAGQVLFREGDRGQEFIAILSGAVTVLDHQAGVVRELAIAGPGEFVAELNILTGERVFTTAVIKESGSVLAVPLDRLQEVIAQNQVLADLILQTAFRRRKLLLRERARLPSASPASTSAAVAAWLPSA